MILPMWHCLHLWALENYGGNIAGCAISDLCALSPFLC